MEATLDLRERIPGFITLRFEQAGDGRILVVDLKSDDGTKQAFRFDELSDGQRVLIMLYTLLRSATSNIGVTVCLDEPANFLALPEIQPWVDALYDFSEEDNQGLIISHHPRVFNALIENHGIWFSRRDFAGPTRTTPVRIDQDAELSVAEMMARQWFDGNL